MLKNGKLFNQYFVYKLRMAEKRRLKRFKDIKKRNIPYLVNLQQYDDLYVAPESGFQSGM